MGTNECSQPASKCSWDSQDFGDVNMVLKMVHFHKSSRPQWVKVQMRIVSAEHSPKHKPPFDGLSMTGLISVCNSIY